MLSRFRFPVYNEYFEHSKAVENHSDPFVVLAVHVGILEQINYLTCTAYDEDVNEVLGMYKRMKKALDVLADIIKAEDGVPSAQQTEVLRGFCDAVKPDTWCDTVFTMDGRCDEINLSELKRSFLKKAGLNNAFERRANAGAGGA